EITDAGTRGTQDAIKGVKRKKIVTENHLKKIPKSPLRSPAETKVKQSVDPSPLKALPDASKHTTAQDHLPLQNGNQCTKQNGGVLSSEISVETTKSETSMQAKLSVTHQSLDLGKQAVEDTDANCLNSPEKKSLSNSSSSKTKTDSNECINFVDCSTSSPCTRTAFDVLLKAMEPELNTLTQECPPYGMQIEKLRPNKTVSTSSSITSNTISVQNQSTLPQHEFASGAHYYRCSLNSVHVAATAKTGQAQGQSVSHSQDLITKTSQQNPQVVMCPSFTRSLVHQHSQENPKVQQIYSIAVTSSVVHTSSSTVTQVFPQNQLVASSSSPLSISTSSSTHLSIGPVYNSTQIASVVNHGAEQICNLLKDQKPKKLGKYVCEYCNRACAKPSVLQKHIRSHTGERPYPCVTCGFSFKTKSNLYKHKKSHAHAIKLGLVLQPDSGGLFLSHDSDKALSIHSDAEESGESEDEGTADERQDDQELEPAQIVKVIPNTETLQKGSPVPLSNPDCIAGDSSLHDAEPQVRAALPKVVVHPVNVSPLRADSPKVTEPAPELAAAQRKGDFKVTAPQSNLAHTASVKENDIKQHQKAEMGLLEDHLGSAVGAMHAQLQRQQATDGSQDQQGKCLLSPRSLGSTDSGYFSRSESADQTMSPPAPFVRGLLTSEKDSNKTLSCVPRGSGVVASVVQTVCAEKNLILSGPMRPPMATKTLEERISKLISDNEAVVDDKQLDSVKPRRTSLSRRGSIDSPKSYIFKDSFQFDLKPMGRRTSSSSDIPKSPFTPTEKSKQVFLLSVPSLDCLPITRSNSMPTTSYSAVPPNVIPPSHPLRGSQSFDDKIGSLYDDVFVSGPATPLNQGGHPRTLVRQAAIEDSSAGESQVLGPMRSVEENYLGCNLSNESLLQRSKSLAQGSNLEKTKKSPQVRGTMFECETCRNRYRKLENFENHKKFYCSELHGPKTKAAVREPEHKTVPNSTQPQILHYRVTTSTGVWEQTPQIRKRRKMKSVGDDDDPQQNDTSVPLKNTEGQSKPANSSSLSKHSATTVVGSQQPSNLLLQSSQIQLVARGTDQSTETKTPPLVEKQTSSAVQEKVELKRQGTGISVIQHTNSLSRNSSFEKSESFERVSPSSSQEPNKVAKHHSLNTIVIQEDRHSHLNTPQHRQPLSSEAPRGEVQGSQIASNERSVPLQPSRLVRQHNIQVPEILVTEEPDRDHENQCSDQEKTERFNWPQRSETLSKLPTEKLPPKKKRIRLAEMEHSSAESSVDSTLSRSLSRESSLSHASSFSTSLDKDETLKAENPSKAEPVAKPSEFLMIPAGSHTLTLPGPHYREMRRAASEQISCTQPSMEVVDYRSKSFDCGSMSPSKPIPVVEIAAPKVSSANGVTGHVPLLERRRGPFVRQISLNIAPENHQSQVKSTSSFQPAHVTDVPTGPLHRLSTSSKSLVEFPSSTQHSQPHSRPHSAIQNCNPVSLSSVQQPLDHVLSNQGQPSSTHQASQTSTKMSAHGEQGSTSALSCRADEKKDCFAPKYQLHVKTLHIGQPYSSKLLKNSSSTQAVPSQVGVEQNASSFELQTKLSDMSNPYSVPPLKQIVPNNCSSQIQQIPPFVVPVRIHSSVPSYGFATVTPLPHILVTQDQVNQSICKTNVTVPMLEGKTQLPNSHKDHQRTLPNSFEFENSQAESGTRNSPLSNALNLIQKVPVSGLFPQPEATASSKRMLSPANSLDIAMEKQQKRVKDESGAACMTDARPLHSLSIRSNDPTGKQKKPVLVRQVCTTEPLESHLLDPDGVPQHEKSSKAAISDLLLPDCHSSDAGVSETLKKSPEAEDLKSSASPVFVVRKPSELSPVNNQSSLLKAVSSSQERRPPSSSNESKHINSQGQAKPGTTLAAMNAGEMQRLSFPSLKTTTSLTWCYLLKRKPLHLLQNDQKISAYSTWTISPNNPNPLGLSTKVALSLLNSKQKVEKPLYTQARTTHPRSDVLVYSSKWKNSLTKRALNRKKMAATEFSNKENSESSTEHDKENSFTKTEPRRVKIFDGGQVYKSNEDYVYVRGRGRGKYICEECGIRCKKPSMLKKHIRTHTDVRPYHCNYCNFSFKTKGNLTKHMKSKAHSKKCMDLGVSVGLIDDQDGEEEFGEKQRFGYDRSGYDVEESDGADEDDNDNEDDDEDSQAESVLSTTPSVTASPQHHPSRHSLQDAASTDEDIRLPDCFAGVHTDSMDGLPKALLTKMTILSTVQSASTTSRSPAELAHQEAHEDKAQERGAGPRSASAALAGIVPTSPGHQMSVDYPDPGAALSHPLISTAALTKSMPAVSSPSSPVHHSMQVTEATPCNEIPEEKQVTEPRAPQTHLFSHLPLHSQRQAKAPYGTVPVGGIQVVPAGLATYSTFVPIQAGPVQLTIPTVSVIHRTTSTLGEVGGVAPGAAANPMGVAEVNSVVPCIPIGQVSVPGIQSLGTPSLQPLPPLGMEAVNILGLANANIAPQMRPSGITLNAVGLQVLTAGTAPQGNPNPQAHIPGLQILNIALPTLIPSVGPVSTEGQGPSEVPASGCSKTCEAQPEPTPVGFSATETTQASRAASPQAGGQQYSGKSHAEPAPPSDYVRLNGPGKADPEKTDLVKSTKPKRDIPSLQVKRATPAEPRSKAKPDTLTKSPLHRTVSPDRQVH
ncbi:ZEP1 protein, partial [Ramphastos sulfuratus]|nr:ZEP1 protein [Ramphastos sulfuratus]